MNNPPDQKSAPVPQSRISRLARMGSLAGRIAGNVALAGGKSLAQGKKPLMSDLLLTPSNLNQVADKLSNMRGAAMKMGQLLSMDSGNLLPDELASILERLRSDAVTMPMSQLVMVLERHWGENWDEQFQRFSFKPLAAASIGQVHEATCKQGRHLAIKVQYPGVRQSIDSDIDNVYSLLRLTGIIPKSLDLQPLMDEARQQLKQEADYQMEGAYLDIYRQHLQTFGSNADLIIPTYHADLSTTEILAMDYVAGESLDSLRSMHADKRTDIMSLIFSLFFAELFDFNCIQTDPNLANYLYQADSHKLVLLDFGAVRTFDPGFVTLYQSAMSAAIREDKPALDAALQTLGFFQSGKKIENRQVVLDIFIMAAEPLRYEGKYAFGESDLAKRIQTLGLSVSRDPDDWHTPPPDVLFLHRKMAGLYLMAARLNASVNVQALFSDYIINQAP
ncbi:AarF/ABC1/UbiB kinase family protein [Amphritea sp. 1_MG-2023]|uniref:ABC1 kinase family protein n=1 Tax=Amphritea sp. 1_MG-2023 TaxID=3062670 RepID=UPI0026E32E74|nr:AarF/ABC1/UbiB kinase family protein [Amphritea sp. 1_MG-2023]MDO6564364.1 AarF/ABC1/UbiB kinase family protein [Amphritea sp. 1_MG-2023]